MLIRSKAACFFSEVGEWFADLRDNVVLVDFNTKIRNLTEDLNCESLGPDARRKTVAELGLYIETRDKIWARIIARDERHEARRLSKQVVH
ncbi:MAG: hypothetical protein WC657_03930 [Candidatus Paceibacterota bacterium]